MVSCALISIGGASAFAAGDQAQGAFSDIDQHLRPGQNNAAASNVSVETLKEQADLLAANIAALASAVSTDAEKAKRAELARVVSQLQENILAAAGNADQIAFLTNELASLQGQYARLASNIAGRKFVLVGARYVNVPQVGTADLLASAPPTSPLPQSVAGAAVTLDKFQDFNVTGSWVHNTDGSHGISVGVGDMSVVTNADNSAKPFASAQYEANITLTRNSEPNGNGNAGIVIRGKNFSSVNDGYNGYYIGLVPGKGVQLGRVQRTSASSSPAWRDILTRPAPSAIVLNKEYKLRVENRGRRIEVFLDDVQVISVNDSSLPASGNDMTPYAGTPSLPSYSTGSFALRVYHAGATYRNVTIKPFPDEPDPAYDFGGVKGAVYTPAKDVNYIDFWQRYDPKVVDQEMAIAQTYGLNFITVYVHPLLWEVDKNGLLNKFKNLLDVAGRYGIDVAPIFYDHCHKTNANIGEQGPPLFGVHNSRWVRSPAQSVVQAYNDGDAATKAKLTDYVSGFVKVFRNDPRIPYFESVNEPGCGSSRSGDGSEMRRLANDARIAWRNVGLSKPILVGTAGHIQDSTSLMFSDIYSIHPYGDLFGPVGLNAFNSETLQRGQPSNNYSGQNLPGIVSTYGPSGKKIGWVIWDLMIGRTNTRWGWDTQGNKNDLINPSTELPATAAQTEPRVPFHGLAYQDGHPMDVKDVEAVTGKSAGQLPVFNVEYFTGAFQTTALKSVTPFINIDMLDEKGYRTPDMQKLTDGNSYSVRWTGKIRAPKSESYLLLVDSDNVARVWINDTKVIDKTASGGNTHATVNLAKGQQAPIKVEYEHMSGKPRMTLSWSSKSMSDANVLGVVAPGTPVN